MILLWSHAAIDCEGAGFYPVGEIRIRRPLFFLPLDPDVAFPGRFFSLPGVKVRGQSGNFGPMAQILRIVVRIKTRPIRLSVPVTLTVEKK